MTDLVGLRIWLVPRGRADRGRDSCGAWKHPDRPSWDAGPFEGANRCTLVSGHQGPHQQAPADASGVVRGVCYANGSYELLIEAVGDVPIFGTRAGELFQISMSDETTKVVVR